ncbi:hypothetical protein PVAP13_3KG184727 [Panicum virgatum]|uniref:Uncharacterized protein n=1 Tax=Panicum virgatum TaxID=38727 RepID=A0A8T0US02_PANVG|nr:hypothetical protein PVAP13_3KG184727 [Panicum virgatum]
MCKLLIEDFQANVDATDVEGATPLVFAVQGTGSTAVVSLLLSHGADANKADNGGISPLHIAAAERGFYEVAELLMSKGADVDPICENGGAPVHIAAKNGHAKVLKLLLRNKADSERLSTSFNTPLVASLFGSSVECLEVLIEAGVDVNAGSPATPLTLAADKGLTEFINCLLEAGADANIPDEEDENIQHLFIGCVVARQFWYSLLHSVGLSQLSPAVNDSPFDAWWERVAAAVTGDVQRGLNSLIILGAWCIWKHRNNCVFNGASPSVASMLSMARDEAHLWTLAGAKGLASLSVRVVG